MAGSTIRLTKDEIRMFAPSLNLDAEGSDGDLHVGADGVTVKKLVADNVRQAIPGGNWYVDKNATDAQVESGTFFRSLAAAAAVLRGKHLTSALTINVVAGDYIEGLITIDGVTGSNYLRILGSGVSTSNLKGTQLLFRSCTILLELENISLSQMSTTMHGVYLQTCTLYVNACKFTALDGTTSTYAAIVLDYGSRALVEQRDIRSLARYNGSVGRIRRVLQQQGYLPAFRDGGAYDRGGNTTL